MTECLPDYWKRPVPVLQRTLFPEPLDKVLCDLEVTKDDLRAWHKRGWLSFDVDDVNEVDAPDRDEIRFLSGLARLGIPEPNIDHFLIDLPRPFSFNSDALAYHLDFGWVVADQPDAFSVIEDSVEEWLHHLKDAGSSDRLAQIAETTIVLLKELAEEHGEAN